MIRAVLFDLHGTLTHVENPVSDFEISDYLFSRGYEVSPQQLRATWFYVSMIPFALNHHFEVFKAKQL